MATQFKSAVYTSSGVKDVIPVDYMQPGDAPITAIVAVTNTPTMTLSIEGTLDNPADPLATWFAVPGGSALTATTTIVLVSAWRAIRLNITAWTAGNAQWWVLQGDGGGQ